jgi:hypothetical protein
MALPLLFVLAGSLVRAATPTIARFLAQRGAKKVAESGVKNAIKKYGTPKNITSMSKVKNMKGSGASAASKEVMKKFPVPKNKALTVKKPKSTIGGKIIASGATATTLGVAAGPDNKTKKAEASTIKDVSQGSTIAKKKTIKTPTGVSQGSTTSTMTFGKAFRAAKDAGKKEFMFRGKRYNTRTKDEEKAMIKNQALPKARPKKSSNTAKKKVETPKGVSQGSTTAKKEAPKKKESRLDANGNYKGTNIKPTKLQLERLKKRGLA